MGGATGKDRIEGYALGQKIAVRFTNRIYQFHKKGITMNTNVRPLLAMIYREQAMLIEAGGETEDLRQLLSSTDPLKLANEIFNAIKQERINAVGAYKQARADNHARINSPEGRAAVGVLMETTMKLEALERQEKIEQGAAKEKREQLLAAGVTEEQIDTLQLVESTAGQRQQEREKLLREHDGLLSFVRGLSAREVQTASVE